MWEATQYLAAVLERSESEAAERCCTPSVVTATGPASSPTLLYQTANDRGWASEAGAYDTLIAAWPSLRVGAAGVAASVRC